MSRNDPMVSAEILTVTPHMAKEWLAVHEFNRALRPGWVATLAGMMLAGEFMLTGEAIKFDDEGNLLDGQHRLHACVDCGVSFDALVVRGVKPEAQIVMDTQRKRTAGDALRFAGVPAYHTDLAATSKVVISWDEGTYRNSGVSAWREVTHQEIVKWTLANQDAATTGLVLANRVRKSPFVAPSKTTLAAVYFVLARIDRDGADAFLTDMADLRMQGKGDPLYTLQSRLTSAKSNRETLRIPALLFLYFRVWNARRDGEPLHQLKVGFVGSQGGLAPIKIPTPR